MDYRIALSPDLEVKTEELVAAWNESSECRKIAAAETEAASTKSFLDPNTAIAFIGGVLGKVAVDVIKDLLKERVKALIEKKFAKKKEVEVESVRQPDGSYLIILK